MAKKNLLRKLVLVVILVAGTLCNAIDVQAGKGTNSPETLPKTKGFSCSYPTSYEERVMCRGMEDQILASTVRIEMLAETYFGQSHATVVGGRYLVTHNHYYFSLRDRSGNGYRSITLRRANGELLLDKAPLSSFKVIHEDAEALVLEFVDQKGRSLFDLLGVPSAQAIDWKGVLWRKGMEIAVVDWNRKKAHVDWVVLVDADLDGVVPNIQVDNATIDGASGGGAFWDGCHVGNIWAWGRERDAQSGQVIRHFTLLALNSVSVAGLD